MTNYRKGLTLVFSTALISGFSIWLNAFGVKGFNPSVFAGLKNIAVGLLIAGILVTFHRWHHVKSLKKKEWLQLITIGLLGGSVPFILFFNGLVQTTGAKAGFIHKTLFIYVALMAVFFLKEKITWKIGIGLGALLMGQVLFLNIKPTALSLGDLMIFGATLLWAGETILSKYVLKKVDPTVVAGGRMFFGAIFIWAFLFATNQWQSVTALSLQQINWVVITSVLLVGYVMTYYHGLKRVPAHVAASILALGAPITLLLQAIFLDKTISGVQIGGIILIATALTFIIRSRTKIQPETSYVPEADHR